ncbi:MAG: DUF3810 domain-containing protein [Bacteroidetes bacterium]|nr:DUF3810 domain-containing protein [Bacteroidota bacterium]
MSTKRKIAWICLVVLAVVIKVFSMWPDAVEKYYSRGFYLFLSRLQRILFGWIPFSIGDVFYGILLIGGIYGLVRLIRRLVRREAGWQWLLGAFRRVVFFLLWVYVLFNGLWGLNYDRQGIASQLQLTVKPYTTAELTELVGRIAGHLNNLDSMARLRRPELSSSHFVYRAAVGAYDSLSYKDERFAYKNPSVKSSLFSGIGAYIGFSGYYNPFTGEAQLNTVVPAFTQPYTTCHEMGHQLGYAKENEANFAGYLSARSSSDEAFRYSAYFELYLYAASELYGRDSTLAKGFREKLRPGIRQDFRELQAYNRKYANPMETHIWRLYGGYLRANHQPKGIVTYTEVTAWLIAYAKKNGWDSI